MSNELLMVSDVYLDIIKMLNISKSMLHQNIIIELSEGEPVRIICLELYRICEFYESCGVALYPTNVPGGKVSLKVKNIT